MCRCGSTAWWANRFGEDENEQKKEELQARNAYR